MEINDSQRIPKDLNHFSVNEDFWVHFNSHLISFGFKGLPKDIHFTIGFDSRSTDINLHLTRNTTDRTNKPKIRIVVFEKSLLEDEVLASKLILRVIGIFLEPLDISNLTGKENIKFISLEDFQNQIGDSFITKNVFNRLQTKIKKKTRLKVQGNIERALLETVDSKIVTNSILNTMTDFEKMEPRPFESGIIVTEKQTIKAIRIYNDWFTIKENLTGNEVLSTIIPSPIVKRLIQKVKRAIVQIRRLETYKEGIQFDNPIRLIKKEI